MITSNYLYCVDIIVMSYITYSPNQTVYVRGIGYATLLNCGQQKLVAQKVDLPNPHKKSSLIFDPDLFSTDPEPQPKSAPEKKQKQQDRKPPSPEPAVAKEKEGQPQQSLRPGVGREQQDQPVNLVQARLQGTNAVISTSDRNLSKVIFVRVKPFLVTKRDQVTIQIEITKTIDSLRKAIFHQLDESMTNYYNIRLCGVCPKLTQLNAHSKTIAQCQIKDNDKLILTAEYAFNFKPLPPNPHPNLNVSISGHTLTASRNNPAPAPPNPHTPIALPAISEQPQLKKEQVKGEEGGQKGKSEADARSQSRSGEVGLFHARCNAEYDCGRKYWQIKIEKLPEDEQQLLVGVCIDGQEGARSENSQGCGSVWGYQMLSAMKVTHYLNPKTREWEQESDSYGYIMKQNDVVGVLLSCSGNIASLTFYKNSINCGQAFQIDQAVLKKQRKKLIPFVNIGGDGQVTLDSKPQYPLDSFRTR